MFVPFVFYYKKSTNTKAVTVETSSDFCTCIKESIEKYKTMGDKTLKLRQAFVLERIDY